jgi:RNA polymerase sigma-70 factor (ECF subfamily)
VPTQLGLHETVGGPTVDPSRFRGPEADHPGHWTSAGAPRRWSDHPEDHALSREAITLVEAALEQLPRRQRAVVTMRDVHGFSSEEVCQLLEISAENQRVLLHRGRTGLRQVLEDYFRPLRSVS